MRRAGTFRSFLLSNHDAAWYSDAAYPAGCRALHPVSAVVVTHRGEIHHAYACHFDIGLVGTRVSGNARVGTVRRRAHVRPGNGRDLSRRNWWVLLGSKPEYRHHQPGTDARCDRDADKLRHRPWNRKDEVPAVENRAPARPETSSPFRVHTDYLRGGRHLENGDRLQWHPIPGDLPGHD